MCVKLCALHEYLTLQLLLKQLHFANSPTDFGTGDTFDTVGKYLSSSSSSHPNRNEHSIVGSTIVSCAHMFAWYCEISTYVMHGDTRSGNAHSTSWCDFLLFEHVPAYLYHRHSRKVGL